MRPCPPDDCTNPRTARRVYGDCDPLQIVAAEITINAWEDAILAPLESGSGTGDDLERPAKTATLAARRQTWQRHARPYRCSIIPP